MKNTNETTAELYLAVYKVSAWFEIANEEKRLELEIVAESNIEAIEDVRRFLIVSGAENFSFHCRLVYTLLWAFVAV